jgi:hypothetical protein
MFDRNHRIPLPHDGEYAAPWPVLPVLALVLLAWLVLGAPWLSGFYTFPWDAKAQFQPQIQFLAQSLARGESPFWTPFVFSGHPQGADPQSMIFSPPFLLLALLDADPGLWAVDTTVLVTILVGAFAVALWFRDQGWHWAGAALAAIPFAFGASMAWRIQHTGQVLSLVYLAIVMLLLSRALRRGSWGYGLSAGIVAAFMVLGRDQVALLGVYMLVLYVPWRVLVPERGDASGLGARSRRALPALVAGGIAGTLLIALPVAMTALIAEQSNRPEIDLVGAGRGSLHPALLVTALAPDVFGSSGPMADYWGPPSYTWRDTGLFIAQNMGQLYFGAVPVLLLLLGLFTGTLWRREVLFYTLAFAGMLVYALGWYTPALRLLHAHLPGVDFFRRPADATFLIGYLAAILSGYVAHRLFAEPLWRPGRLAIAATALVTAGGFAYALAMAVHFDRVKAASWPLAIAFVIVAGGAIAILAARRMEPLRPVAAALLLVGCTVGDLAYSNGPGGANALPPQYYEVLEPGSKNDTIATLKRLVAAGRSDTRRDRVELIGLGFHWPNASLTHRLENTLGYNPVRLDLYSRAVGAGDVSGSPGDRRFPPLFASYRSPLANHLGLRYIASSVPIGEIDKALQPGDLDLVARTRDAYIYENPRALPRVLYAPYAQTMSFEWMIANGSGFSTAPQNVVLLEQAPPQHRSARRPGTARIVSYANTEVVISANGEDGGWVVLHDVWHPWWRVSIDGVPAELLRANVIFRAVHVPPGEHTVRFSFHPVDGALRTLAARLRADRP